jgi:16S rRNA (guanine527-N7)-methyltransferase
MLEAHAAFFHVPVSAEQRSRVTAFFDLLLTWNRRINLTGAASMEELLSEHFPDSLALARLVPANAAVADVGSGGGLPALPFAVLRPDATVTLFETRAKRVAFLRTAVRELSLRSVSVAGRFAPAALAAHQRFDVASSRATFPPEEWMSLARQALRPGGRVVVFDAAGGSEPAPADGLGAPMGQLIESVEYHTGRRHLRRAAAYCFT